MLQSVIRIGNLAIALTAVKWSSIVCALANDGDDFILKDGALIVTAITEVTKSLISSPTSESKKPIPKDRYSILPMSPTAIGI